MTYQSANITDIHKGDILYESEYGTTVEIEVLEEPIINHEENYWRFHGRTRRGIVTYGGHVEGGAYSFSAR